MRKQRWLRAGMVAALAIICANWGLSIALRDGWARRSLLARVSASFGRPVEVGYFGFTLLGGMRLEAQSVTVREDPRFGAEYFLRAEKLTASPRWGALLRGRLELGTISFTGASLNLVRAADGSWNVESWLPPKISSGLTAQGSHPSGSTVSQPAIRLSHIDIDQSRINFKRGDDKLPFALVDVSGSLNQDTSGRWGIDIEAHPMRASVVLQEAGTLRLRGTISGTSARLQPASISLVWEDASIADAIRLVQGTDYGIRGKLTAELATTIQTSPEVFAASLSNAPPSGVWAIAGKVRLFEMHRWDLPPRQTDPAVNVNVTAEWDPGGQHVALTNCTIEAPHSIVSASGEVDWLGEVRPVFRVLQSEIAFADLLEWRRAFLPGLADSLTLDGSVQANATLAGWPLRVDAATLQSAGAAIRAPGLDAPVRLGQFEASVQRGSLVLKPVDLQLASASVPPAPSLDVSVKQPPQSGGLRLEGELGPKLTGTDRGKWTYRLALRGATPRTQDLLRLASSLGRPVNTQLTLEGPSEIQFVWSGGLRQSPPQMQGTIRFHGTRLRSPLLDEPVILSAASVELRPNATRVKVDAAEAFGTYWTGSLERPAAQPAWNFDLSADRLDVAELSRWVGAGEQRTLLKRLLPFGESPAAAVTRQAALQGLSAQGRLRVRNFKLAPLSVDRLDARVTLTGQDLTIRGVKADAYGGRIAGEFTARLSDTPSYEFRGDVDGADVLAIAAIIPSLAGRIAGSASGRINAAARGVGRSDLLGTLQGAGSFRIRDVMVRSPELLSAIEQVSAGTQVRTQGRFGSATTRFQMSDGILRVEQLSFGDRNNQFQVAGDVSFDGALDLRVTAVPRTELEGSESAADATPDSWLLNGTLQSPELAPPARIARIRAGAAAASR